jgi:hypothetical protein
MRMDRSFAMPRKHGVETTAAPLMPWRASNESTVSNRDGHFMIKPRLP